MTSQSLVDRDPRRVARHERGDEPAVVVERADRDPARRERAGAVVLAAVEASGRRRYASAGLQVLGVRAAALGQRVADPRAGQHVGEQARLLRGVPQTRSTSTNRKCAWGTCAIDGSTAAMHPDDLGQRRGAELAARRARAAR